MKGKHFEKKKVSIKRVILLIVALVLAAAVLTVSTAAWVETVSTYRIYTSNNEQYQSPAVQTGTIMNAANHRASVSAGSTSSIDLSNMIHESGDFHLAAASSANGAKIIFPSAKGQAANYREATASDNNVNFVSISFKVTNANAFLFSGIPTIAFDGTALQNSSLVRVAIGKGNSYKIFSLKSETNQSVVAQQNGTSETTNVYSFSDFASGVSSSPVISVSAGEIMTLRIWIQDPSHSEYGTYSGKKITISGLSLVPAYQVKAITSVNNSEVTTTDVGKVQAGNSPEGAVSTTYVRHGSNVQLKATLVATGSNYEFAGWADTASGSASGTSPLTINNVTGNVTKYAKFNQMYTITAKGILGTDVNSGSTTYGQVKIGNGNLDVTVTARVETGSSVLLTAEPASGYTVDCWYVGNTSTVVPNSNGKTQITVSVSSNVTYYVSFRQLKTTKIYMLDRGNSDMRIYVWGKYTGQKYTAEYSSGGGNGLSLDKSRGLYYFTFTTGSDENIGIIISNGGDDNTKSEYEAHVGETCLIKQSGDSIDRSFTLGSKKFVYFSNNKNWNSLKCYYTNGGSGWPGNDMTYAYTTSNEAKYYREVTTSSTIVFNNNGNTDQTVDISGSASECRYYLTNKNNDNKWEVGTW